MMLSACFASSLALFVPQEAGGVTTRFAWPVPCEVRVTEEKLKKGQKVKVRYTARLEKADESSEDLRLALDDWDILELRDRPVPESMRPMLASMLTMLSVVPRLRISPDGAAIATEGMDEMIERVLELQTKTGRLDERTLEALRQSLSSDQMKAMIEESARNFWRAWVETWVGLEDLRVGTPLELESTVHVGSLEIPIHVRFQNLGSKEEPEGRVRLAYESTFDPEKGKEAIQELIETMAESMGKGGDLPADAILSLQRSDRIEVVTDPATLRPLYCFAEKVMEVKGKEEERREVERSEYTFDWSVNEKR